MFVTQPKKYDIKTVRQGDPNFHLSDGIVLYPRAMLQVEAQCPANVRSMIEWALSQGYIKCVAHVQGKEITWQNLVE